MRSDAGVMRHDEDGEVVVRSEEGTMRSNAS